MPLILNYIGNNCFEIYTNKIFSCISNKSRLYESLIPNWNQGSKYGFLTAIQWLHVNRTEGCTADAMNTAAENGHLDIVQCYTLTEMKNVQNE